jgi:hypothetical protein
MFLMRLMRPVVHIANEEYPTLGSDYGPVLGNGRWYRGAGDGESVTAGLTMPAPAWCAKLSCRLPTPAVLSACRSEFPKPADA